MKNLMTIAAIVAIPLGMLITGSPAVAAGTAQPQVDLVPSNSQPPVPDGLKMTCMVDGKTLQLNTLCPVVRYRGVTTWAYSFIDNRVSMALVSYDFQNNIVGNVTKDGARYVWRIMSNPAKEERLPWPSRNRFAREPPVISSV
jgi:hypothetical protein